MGAARVAELYGRYEEAKRRQGVLDLDDLLWACADALEGDDRFAAAVRWRFRHVFVDEMQDVNPSQFRLLRALVGEDPDLFVVGDPHQSVYGWNGADPGLLDRLGDLFPSARVVRLGENHRCSPQVVAVASAALGSGGRGRAHQHQARRGGAPRGAAAHRGRRGGLGGPAGVAGPPPGPAMVADRRAGPHQRPARPGARGAAGRAGPGPAGRWRPGPGQRPAPPGGPGARRRPRPGPAGRRARRRARRELRGGRRRRGAHHLPPGQGPAVAGRLRDRPLRRAGADRLGPHQGGPGRGAATALRGPHPGRGRAHLHLGRPAGPASEEAGTPPRRPSPWLEEVARAGASMAGAPAAPEPGDGRRPAWPSCGPACPGPADPSGNRRRPHHPGRSGGTMGDIVERLREVVGDAHVTAGEGVNPDDTHDESLTGSPVVPAGRGPARRRRRGGRRPRPGRPRAGAGGGPGVGHRALGRLPPAGPTASWSPSTG